MHNPCSTIMIISNPCSVDRLSRRPRLFGSRAITRALMAATSLLLLQSQWAAQAQSDNFDSYSSTADLKAGGWFLSSLNPALVTTTFPAVGAGKGLRVQANPVPGQ